MHAVASAQGCPQPLQHFTEQLAVDAACCRNCSCSARAAARSTGAGQRCTCGHCTSCSARAAALAQGCWQPTH
eukprot:7045243-Alexandrium_andersonii.AAC.1